MSLIVGIGDRERGKGDELGGVIVCTFRGLVGGVGSVHSVRSSGGSSGGRSYDVQSDR